MKEEELKTKWNQYEQSILRTFRVHLEEIDDCWYKVSSIMSELLMRCRRIKYKEGRIRYLQNIKTYWKEKEWLKSAIANLMLTHKLYIDCCDA